MIAECLTNGRSFAVDNTNPTRYDRARYIPLAKPAGYRIIGYFMQAEIGDCIARNAQREGRARVPDKAITATAHKLELPALDEGFDELYVVKNDGATMTIEPWEA